MNRITTITPGQVFVERHTGDGVTVLDVLIKDDVEWVVAKQGVAYDHYEFEAPADAFRHYYRSEPLAS